MDLKRLIGRGYPYILVSQLLLGLLYLMELLGVVYYPMIERRTAGLVFQLGFSMVAPLLALTAFWLGVNLLLGRRSLLMAAAPLFICMYSVELGLAATSLSMSITGVWFMEERGRFYAALCWVLSLFLGVGVVQWGVLWPLGLASPLTGVSAIMFRVHHVLRWLFPVLVLPFLFFWILKPLIGPRWKLPEVEIREGGPTRFSVVLLVFALFFSVYLAIFPRLPTVNPNEIDFGVDIMPYLRSFQKYEARSSGLLDLLGNSRGFFYIILIMFRAVSGLDLHNALRFLPVVLNPWFVAGSYYFCLEVFRNHEAASWCAFLSATGVFLAPAMRTYYLTNILALGLALFSFGLLWRALRFQSPHALAGACVLAFLLVYTHPWTLDQYLSGLVAALGFVLYRREEGYRRVGLYSGVYLGALGLSEVIKVFVFGSMGGAEASSAVVGGLIGFDEMLHDILYAFRLMHKGTMSNIVLVALAVAGIYLLKMKGLAEKSLGFMVAFSSLLYVISSSARKTRLLMNLPFGFFSGLVVYHLYEKRNTPFIVFTVFYSLYYVLVSVGSLVM